MGYNPMARADASCNNQQQKKKGALMSTGTYAPKTIWKSLNTSNTIEHLISASPMSVLDQLRVSGTNS